MPCAGRPAPPRMSTPASSSPVRKAWAAPSPPRSSRIRPTPPTAGPWPSKSFDRSDADQIHRIIRLRCKGGFHGVNSEICAGLRGWLHSAAFELAKAPATDPEDEASRADLAGSLFKAHGKLAEAEQLFRWALEGREGALGPDHKETLATVGNLASLLKAQGKAREAEPRHATDPRRPAGHVAAGQLFLAQAQHQLAVSGSRSSKQAASTRPPMFHGQSFFINLSSLPPPPPPSGGGGGF